jgi:Cu2+-exporting ATPase
VQPIRAELQFCCNGCRLAWQLLHEYGLDNFYSLCEEQGTSPRQAQSTGHDFSEFDDPAFLQNHVRHLPDGLMEAKVLIEGIHCAACVWLIEKLPRLSKGVVEIRVSLGSQTATIRWKGDVTTLAQIAQQLDKIGYQTHPRSDGMQEALHRKQTRQQLLNLAVAGACAGNAMLLAFALYGGLFGSMASEHLTVLRYASALVGMTSLAWPGRTFFRGAWRALVNRTPHMDISLALGLAAGGIMGLINTLRGAGEIYFDSLCMLVFVLLIGRFFQYRQQRQAAESVALLRNLMPRTAHRVNEKGQIQRIHTDALRVGDLVEIHPGDLVPTDGMIETGASTLDQSLLTGESAGVIIKAGERIPAGATNLSAFIRMRVAAVGRATRIGKLMDLVEAESVARVPLVELANRVSGYFLSVVLVLALLTLVLWAGSGVDLAVDHAIALLIVACPCALGLATPLTIAVAQGRAARQAILIRSGEVFERLKRPGMLWLDKTGTVTEGKMTLRAWHGDKAIMPQVLAIEENIVHPLADCLVKAIRSSLAESRQWTASSCQKQVYEPGRGVRGMVDGKAVVVGSREFLKNNGVDLSAETSWPIEAILEQGWTPIYFACDEQLVAVAVVGDSIRTDAVEAIKTLRDMSWKVGLLSGDHPDVVRRIAAKLNIPEECALGGVMPEDKLALVRSTPAGATVVMVGDGVNDAAALAAADVGVAVHGGAEASLLAAPVYLGHPGLGPLVELIHGSQRALGAIRNGLLVSLSYNIFAISLAMAGYITPLLAAILMPISSLTVTILAVLQRSIGRSA